jgi:hypothetical protein
LPSARRAAALMNVTDPFSKPFLEKIQLGGETTGTAIDPVRIGSMEEFEAAFAEMEKKRPDAINSTRASHCVCNPGGEQKKSKDFDQGLARSRFGVLRRDVQSMMKPNWPQYVFVLGLAVFP